MYFIDDSKQNQPLSDDLRENDDSELVREKTSQ